MLSPARIAIELSNREALVLFEFLRRSDDQSCFSFEHQAEERVLWTLEGMLETQLVEIFSPDYGRFLADAREAVKDKED
jgi:hypothetical protein